MIDFSKITQTLDGCKAIYANTRQEAIVIHEFAIVHPRFGASIEYYNENGIRVTYDPGKAKWLEIPDARFQIVKPKKKVSVTRWLAFEKHGVCVDGIFIRVSSEKPTFNSETLDIQQHTFTFEVDE